MTKGANLFPRVDMDQALAELEAIRAASAAPAQPAIELEPWEEEVDFDTFCKSDFRVVKVKACEAVKKSKKLLKFTLTTARHRPADPLRHRHVLQARGPGGQDPGGHREPAPRKMMGQESQGCSCPLCTRRTGRKSST